MMIRFCQYVLGALLLLSILSLASCAGYQPADSRLETQPEIYPLYSGVTLPPNIAPTNFLIKQPAEDYQIEIGTQGERHILIRTTDPKVEIPQSEWSSLLDKAKGGDIFVRISMLQSGKWVQYADIINHVDQKPIDGYLVYRLLYPGYELWKEMGIYQRDLSTHEETPIAENKDFDQQCINCHSFSANSPSNAMLHVRGSQGGTFIHRNGAIEIVKPKVSGQKHNATYPSWSADGKFIAYSVNEVRQFFHASGQKNVEVSDLESDLIIYDTATQTAFTDSIVYGSGYMETFPTWAPDGRTIYFCRSEAYTQGQALDSIRYDLYALDFDAQTKQMSRLRCVYPASEHGKSVSFPRVSPDGRWLMFTQSSYGNFSIWHPESDLYVLDLQSGAIKALDGANSGDVDSYHSWSSDGEWFVFSSKCLDGLWARPHIAKFDRKTGVASTAFVLPQRDPTHYDNFLRTYNIPELVKERVPFGSMLVERIRGNNSPPKP